KPTIHNPTIVRRKQLTPSTKSDPSFLPFLPSSFSPGPCGLVSGLSLHRPAARTPGTHQRLGKGPAVRREETWGCRPARS
ncbi:hypothetical protein A6R68_14045, partial [Neotoma lepida]